MSQIAAVKPPDQGHVHLARRTRCPSRDRCDTIPSMKSPARYSNPFATRPTRHPVESWRLRQTEMFFIVLGFIATILQHGLHGVTSFVWWEMGLVTVVAMLFLTASIGLRYRWSLARATFLQTRRSELLVSAIWLAGIAAILVVGGVLRRIFAEDLGRPRAIVLWSEICLAIRVVIHMIRGIRLAAGGRRNPAMLLVVSFLLLIVVGTALLMLPRSCADHETLATPLFDRLRIALFTATSATCVTGLTVVNTGGAHPYWSPLGQVVILALIQLGGLGIMTCGAFFAVAGGSVAIRESTTMAELLESEQIGHVRRLVLTILMFTLASEVIGAVLLSGLWDGRPFLERAFFSIFHSVSAFCNAGFTLTDNNLLGWATRWQVWGVVAGLIILGGLGFAVIYNIGLIARSRWTSLRRDPLFGLSRVRVRVVLTSRLVLVTTAGLLAAGTIGYFLLESPAMAAQAPVSDERLEAAIAGEAPLPEAGPELRERIADAWFQSVTFRTAGFNTTDHTKLQPATKLFAIALMFIGASPGSTGGGIKTTCFALMILGLVSILRGREHAEMRGRTIPDVNLKRAFAVISLGLAAVMTTTMLVVVFERRPERFLDHLFEATSAFGTVGVSSIGTQNLTVPSQYVIMVTMFLGRVGPLTLLMALAGTAREARYEYPLERVTLG
jgi:trk system potassium uptake protein TrkH